MSFFLSPLKTGSSTSIEHPATSISTPPRPVLARDGQAIKLVDAHKLVDLPASRFGGIRAGEAELRYGMSFVKKDHI